MLSNRCQRSRFTGFYESMENKTASYVCVNCGKKVKSLFKKYSSNVLKLTSCENCHSIADKYVEYDVVIIIIDLVLLQKAAYRHVLFNMKFKNFWKLSVVLLLMEAYSELMKSSSMEHLKKPENETTLFLNEFNEMADFLFYKLSLSVAFKTCAFIAVLYLSTVAYCITQKKECISFLTIWKALTVSSFGSFLLLPSLIWDTSVQEFHLCVVSLYTTLTQLLAYTVLCDCPKSWSIAVVFCAYYCKTFCFDFLNIVFDNLLKFSE